MTDLLVAIRPDIDDPLRAELSHTEGVLGACGLTKIEIGADELKGLRSGSPPPVLRDQITQRVSDWFISAPMRALLQPEVGRRPFRIVIRPDGRIADKLANVPFELARWDVMADDPLLFVNNVLGLVHAAEIAPSAAAPAPLLGTFRVLIIRPEPSALVGTVPSGTALQAAMQAAVPAGVTAEIRVLSNELGDPARRPTWQNIQAEVRAYPPSALFYLGHGDLLDVAPGAPPSPVLFVERDDGTQYELAFSGLRQLFRAKPVPLVVLAGCLTGAAPVAQSMAQLLVTGEGGVTVAIGMRFNVDIARARTFSQLMFAALMSEDPGNVDHAIKSARRQLFTDDQNDLCWAAPIVFRRTTPEPLFPNLRSSGPIHGQPVVPAAPTPDDLADDAAREQLSAIWSVLGRAALASPPDFTSLLLATHAAMRARLAARQIVGLLPRPQALQATPGAVVTVELELTAALDAITELAFELVLRGAGTWQGFAVTAPGFVRDTTDPKDESRKLVVVLRAPATLTLGPGVIARAELAVGPSAPNVIEVSTSAPAAMPPVALKGWVDAVIVRPL